MSAPTVADQTARDQRYARALEQLVEMRGCIEAGEDEVWIAFPTPPDFANWTAERQSKWCDVATLGRARPGDPEDLARAIGEAHANWKASTKL